MKALLKSFGYAFNGFIYALHNERNMRIHVSCLLYMFYFLLRFDFFVLEKFEFALLFLASALVLMGELINTAIETAIDLVEENYNKKAKTAKDTASAAVLISAFFAVLVGLALLWQPPAFKALYEFYRGHLIEFSAFVLSLVFALLYIFVGPLKLFNLSGKGAPSKKDQPTLKGE